jgi:hypothetical protein
VSFSYCANLIGAEDDWLLGYGMTPGLVSPESRINNLLEGQSRVRDENDNDDKY